MSAAEKVPEYAVGYGKPPLHTQFKPGHKLSPGAAGYAGSFMAKVREYWSDGDKLLPILDEALKAPRMSDRLTAVQIILERGWGKAPQPLALTGDNQLPIDSSKLSDDEFKALGSLLSKLIVGDSRPSSQPEHGTSKSST